MSCNEAAKTRDQALNLLSEAAGDCLDKAVDAVERYAPSDRAAAYLTRYERKHDPVDLLRALDVAEGFNRALALEWLGLTKEAIHSWSEVTKESSGWSEEAREHLQRLQALPDPIAQWRPEAVDEAIRRRDLAALTRIARAFPTDTARWFDKVVTHDDEGARVLAAAVATTGDLYPKAVVDGAKSVEGRIAFSNRDFAGAIPLLERAGDRLSLIARYNASVPPDNAPIEPALAQLHPQWREISSRLRIQHAYLLEGVGRLLEAQNDYDDALKFAKGYPTLIASIAGRRTANYVTIGNAAEGFAVAHHAISLMQRVADVNARNHVYGGAAMAARQLGYPLAALHYQNAAVDSVVRAMREKADTLPHLKRELAVAVRQRAEIYLELDLNADAERDFEEAVRLAEAADVPLYRDQFRMRVRDVRGQFLLKKNDPAGAAASFTEAIALANEQTPTYRAVLLFQRATALRKAGDDRRADEDIAAALKLLREEVRQAIVADAGRASQPLWTPYFSRFRAHYDALIESRIANGDHEGAFVQAELARAFEPMQILLQSGSMPPGFRPIESVASFQQARAQLPADTVLLQFLVLPNGTYTWVVTRERVEVVHQRATRADIAASVANVLASLKSHQPDAFTTAMRSLYGELFRDPLRQVDASKTRIVIVPDEPMQGIPFGSLAGTREEGFLIQRGSVAVAGSSTLYFYALARDRQLSNPRNPKALLIGDPAFDVPGFDRLPYAKDEVAALARDYYKDATVLTDAAATVPRFLAEAKNADVIHFAGHAFASLQDPWQSRLLFAPEGNVSGELTAQQLMQELPELERTRLVVLGACSTAGGASVGPQGLAPLVRPLIAAHVPAVVGSLWDVGDASAEKLLVSIHCHYRHGDDVATALRHAQLERLRNHEPAMTWAAFQVVGYAGSPDARPIAQENDIDHLCTANSLHRPAGLHSQ